MDDAGIAAEMVAPRLWFSPMTIDGAYTSNDPKCRKYAIERFASEIIAVRDSLELARMVELPQDSNPAVQKMHEGLDLTLKLLDDIFRKFGLTLIDPPGQKFDPERHQAISMVDSAEVPPGHVVNVVQKGFLLNDRLLRPDMVVVARAAEPEMPAGPA